MSFTSVMLAGRYRLDEPIAAGAVGEVWRGLDVVLDRPVAVKLLRAEFVQHADVLVRFRAGGPACRIAVPSWHRAGV